MIWGRFDDGTVDDLLTLEHNCNTLTPHHSSKVQNHTLHNICEHDGAHLKILVLTKEWMHLHEGKKKQAQR